MKLATRPWTKQQKPYWYRVESRLTRETSSATVLQRLSSDLLESLWDSTVKYLIVEVQLNCVDLSKKDQFTFFESNNESLGSGDKHKSLLPYFSSIRLETTLYDMDTRPCYHRVLTQSLSQAQRWREIPRVN